MGYKLFFDKSPDKVVCTILSQNIFILAHFCSTFHLESCHALKLLLTVFSLQNGLRHFRIFVSSEHFLFFSFLLPLYLTIIRLNSVKVLTYAHQLQKKRLAVKKVQILLNCQTFQAMPSDVLAFK